MYLKYLPTAVLVVCISLEASVHAQNNPWEDPDLQQLLKQSQEMQKNAHDLQKNAGSRDAWKNLADL